MAAALLLVIVASGSLVSAWLLSSEQRKTADALSGQRLRTKEAEARFRQAHQAVDTLLLISEEELADRPGEEARRRILEVVLSHYEEFIDQRQGDEASQAELSAVQDKVKSILHELNVLQRAMDHRLLENPALQKELQFSTEQTTMLTNLFAQWRDEMHRQSATPRVGTEQQRRAKRLAIAESQEQALAGLLTTTQSRRFRQIAIQAHGLFAFNDLAVVRALALTSEQRSSIREVEREMFAERFRLPEEPPRRPADAWPNNDDDDDDRSKHQKQRWEPHSGRPPFLRKEWVDRALKLLSDD